MPKPPIECIYCGEHNTGSDEHVVQDALGGVDVITDVCERCNKRLADIDRVLVVDSPLSIFVRRELSGVGPNSWDVDTDHSLLLEGRMTPGTDSISLLPQLIFDGEERRMYFDGDDECNLGLLDIEDRFLTRLRRAYNHLLEFGPDARRKDHKKSDMIKFRPVDRIRSCYRFPPRICCEKSLIEIGSKATCFSLRYLTDADRDHVLEILGKFEWARRSNRSGLHTGCQLPEVRIRFCLTHAVMAIMKIGFNLLARFCKCTPVNCHTFPGTVGRILAGAEIGNQGEDLGFIDPSFVAELACPPRSHKFRLTHDLSANMWKMYASFFEGKVAAYVTFAGPNDESWATLDVVAPYDKPLLTPVFHNWYLPLDAPPVAKDLREMVPSLPLQDGETRTWRAPPPQK